MYFVTIYLICIFSRSCKISATSAGNACNFLAAYRENKFLPAAGRTLNFGPSRKPQVLYMTRQISFNIFYFTTFSNYRYYLVFFPVQNSHHYILFLNKKLHFFGIKNTPLYLSVKMREETLIYIFYDCIHIKSL